MADQLTFSDLKELLKKFKYAPPTGHGTTEIDLTVEVDWLYGNINMVRVTTKNVVEDRGKKN